MATHLVARMQPLRTFQLAYVVMILMLGSALGERVLQRRPMRWVVAFSSLAAVMMMAEQRTFPASKHLELPDALTWSASPERGNSFERAFAWIGRNTPKDAVFAMDAQYITKPGEDAQSFRAIAERSVLPDYSKDGGVVTNKPELATAWLQGQMAQAELNDRAGRRASCRVEAAGGDLGGVGTERGDRVCVCVRERGREGMPPALNGRTDGFVSVPCWSCFGGGGSGEDYGFLALVLKF